MALFSKIFKRFCKHEWVLSGHQVLCDDGTMTFKCNKCGTYGQLRNQQVIRTFDELGWKSFD